MLRTNIISKRDIEALNIPDKVTTVKIVATANEGFNPKKQLVNQ